jgi:RNA polymerase sigma-70 factor (ECF subfamily)
MIDSREKIRQFEETIDKNSQWLDVVSRKNAPIDSRQDLKQEILLAFWKSLNCHDGKGSCLDTWFSSVIRNTIKDFRRKNRRMRKRDEDTYPNPDFVEQDRDPLRIVDEFSGKLGELDRQIFTMHFDDLSYAEISAALGVNEVNLRKRMSRIKEKFKTIY